jgi:hypothetical protein
MNSFQRTVALIKQQPTTIPGLKYFPSLEPEISNDRDNPQFHGDGTVEVSDCNLAVVREVVQVMGERLKASLEIGIARNGERSMSMILMRDKPEGSFYLGVDLDDRSYLDDANKNIWTARCNSHDQDTIRNFITGKGIAQLDLLFVDGWHSVNTCVNDWLYTDMLAPNGIVILHDTNAHPGCVALFDAVDEAVFDKQRYCTVGDNGIAVFRKR